jgi:hypothetical protein
MCCLPFLDPGLALESCKEQYKLKCLHAKAYKNPEKAHATAAQTKGYNSDKT